MFTFLYIMYSTKQQRGGNETKRVFKMAKKARRKNSTR